jgi:sec-independent protein translocase protein TatA
MTAMPFSGDQVMGALSPVHLIFILVVALLVLGPSKLPDTGAALGHAIRDFRRAVDGKDAETPPAHVAAVPANAVPSETASVGDAATNTSGNAAG